MGDIFPRSPISQILNVPFDVLQFMRPRELLVKFDVHTP